MSHARCEPRVEIVANGERLVTVRPGACAREVPLGPRAPELGEGLRRQIFESALGERAEPITADDVLEGPVDGFRGAAGAQDGARVRDEIEIEVE
jgi:hypothetical protein